MLPPILARRNAARFWGAVVLTGLGTGLATAALTRLLEAVQALCWGTPREILEGATGTPAWRHIAILLAAGIVAGVGRILLSSGGTGIDINAAIWFRSGRLPAWRTLGNAVLSIIIVGMGAALGREGAPKQAGAVLANVMSDQGRLNDAERRLLVACGAGAGMAAAYGVPLGGALFAMEVMRGALALRFVVPALMTSLVSTGISWLFIPDAPVYPIPSYHGTLGAAVWAIGAGIAIGFAGLLFVRLIAFADSHKPKGRWRLGVPVAVFGVLGGLSVPFPQLLGNGHDVAGLALNGRLGLGRLVVLLLLRPAMTVLCLGSGAPGGLFTPSLATGALLGGVLGLPWLWLWPGTPPGVFAYVGAAAFISATTQGPISTVVLMTELTEWSRAVILPVLLASAIATLVARTIEPRSIYDARLTEAEVRARETAREKLAEMLPRG